WPSTEPVRRCSLSIAASSASSTRRSTSSTSRVPFVIVRPLGPPRRARGPRQATGRGRRRQKRGISRLHEVHCKAPSRDDASYLGASAPYHLIPGLRAHSKTSSLELLIAFAH